MVIFFHNILEVMIEYQLNHSFVIVLWIGALAERFGAKWVFGCGIFIAGILTLLIPIAARVHVGLLIFIRILIGIFEVDKSIVNIIK